MAFDQDRDDDLVQDTPDDYTHSVESSSNKIENCLPNATMSEAVAGTSTNELHLEESSEDESVTSSSSTRPKFKHIELNLNRDHIVQQFEDDVMVFNGEWDKEGVYVYQAFKDEIADYALEHQTYGGYFFQPDRMTWVKPSFAWVLYRSGYGKKHDQNRVLKIKLSHESLATLLSQCKCKKGGGGCTGRVQWDPERDIMMGEGGYPRKMLRRRAIQIGFSKELSHYYVASIISIQDVTPLAQKVHYAHNGFDKKTCRGKTQMEFTKEEMAKLEAELPNERPYMPCCVDSDLLKLKLIKEEWLVNK